ncbi:hypothetical protein ACIBHX_01640 [Nonomuraea sp. NPDC050536]|uniref:hypothetical protein n=1 Tax=Nonomuraea sp. NPDC050536 TaxID=3364366 RepID=UPI0037C7BA4A
MTAWGLFMGIALLVLSLLGFVAVKSWTETVRRRRAAWREDADLHDRYSQTADDENPDAVLDALLRADGHRWRATADDLHDVFPEEDDR